MIRGGGSLHHTIDLTQDLLLGSWRVGHRKEPLSEWWSTASIWLPQGSLAYVNLAHDRCLCLTQCGLIYEKKNQNRLREAARVPHRQYVPCLLGVAELVVPSMQLWGQNGGPKQVG
jgi:hypothetical protein